MDIRAIFRYFFTEKIPINYENITDDITVLSYNYLIFTHHNALYRQLSKKRFFKCMYVLCSSSMMDANVNNSERHNSERQQ